MAEGSFIRALTNGTPGGAVPTDADQTGALRDYSNEGRRRPRNRIKHHVELRNAATNDDHRAVQVLNSTQTPRPSPPGLQARCRTDGWIRHLRPLSATAEPDRHQVAGLCRVLSLEPPETDRCAPNWSSGNRMRASADATRLRPIRHSLNIRTGPAQRGARHAETGPGNG